jgi:predicted pyridoxine 5'-phosphate oxidase superfamily flavin-nucleotide-binding protein
MTNFADIAFTDAVKATQERLGSREHYARLDSQPPAKLGEREAAFLAARDSFYLATVLETGWPYVQHRGGETGFVRVLAENTIGIADMKGNRQYISLTNMRQDSRVAMFFMDYPNRRRLKMFALARVIEKDADPALARALTPQGYEEAVERFMLFDVQAFSWNCSQFITPRATFAEVDAALTPLLTRIKDLETRLAKYEAVEPLQIAKRG